MSRHVAVIGSLNVDFITRTSRLPAAGETLAAISFDTGFGGKGANQAVACARLADDDVETLMVGNVGDDTFGRDYLSALTKSEGIKIDQVKILAGQKTGVTNIIVEEDTGENRILFVANANNAYADQPDIKWELVPEKGDVIVFQLEIPVNVVLHNLHQAREKGRHTILNPAPAVLLPDFVYQDIDTLIMNETESNILAGPRKTEAHDQDSLLHLAKQFLHWGVKQAVVITLGAKGLVYATASGNQGHIPALDVKVVDTTAAGDTFVGAYAAKRAKDLTENFDLEAALTFATTAASKTVQKAGAMGAIPRRNELL